MAFKFYISGQLVDSPNGDIAMSTRITRDDTISGVVITQESTYQWTNENAPGPGEVSGYGLIKAASDSATCSELDIEIYDQVSNTETFLKHKGVIKIPGIELSEQRVQVTTKVEDNSFYSYIYNNKDLKVDLRAIFTKNALPISTLDYWTVDFFNGCTGGFGSSIGVYYKGYLVQEIFEFIIAVISDNKIGFQSDYLDNLTYPLIIFKGQSIRNSFTLYPSAQEPVFEISFQKLFDEITALKNLYWYIDMTDPSAPVMRMESYEDSFTATTGVTITDPLEIKTTIDQNTLYGKITAGSSVTVDGDHCPIAWYTMNEATSYYGFKTEEFFTRGQCNRSIEYRMTNEWAISNNVIQDILIGQSLAYDDQYVIVECDALSFGPNTANAYPWQFYGAATPPFFYNLGLNNYNKLQRHQSKFATTFGNFLGLGTLGFRALLGDADVQDITYMTGSVNNPNFIPPAGLTATADFPNETTNGGFDGSGNYDNVTFQYNVSQYGTYSFHEHLHLDIGGLLGSDSFLVQCRVTLYDSGMVQKAQSSGGVTAYGNGFNFADATLVADCVTGDIVKATYSIYYFPNQSGSQQDARTMTVIWDSYFECNGTPDGGISITTGNASVRNLVHDIEYRFTETEWRQILSNPTGMIPFVKDGVTRYGWIREITRSDQTGKAQIKLLSSNATS